MTGDAPFHELSRTATAAGLVFECTVGCGRRLVVDRVNAKLTVIDRGDPYALHRGSHSDLTLSAPSVD